MGVAGRLQDQLHPRQGCDHPVAWNPVLTGGGQEGGDDGNAESKSENGL